MKKLIAGICVVAILFVIATYYFIPSTLTVSNIVYCKATLPGVYRVLTSQTKWKEWWPNKNNLTGKNFSYNNNSYRLTANYFKGAAIKISDGEKDIKSDINIVEFPDDSVSVNWKCAVTTSKNPFDKIKQYNNAVALKKDMKNILDSFKIFVENDSNIYGIPIKLSSIDHAFLITTKTTFNEYPSTKNIYNAIDFLENYGNKQGLKQTYFPMINVINETKGVYRLMVGLPVDKQTNFSGKINSIQMFKGNFMTTEVKGGYKTINNALDQLQLYFQDYNKTSMAIPFQYLVTDRINEPDTSKWITKIYAPVN